MRISEKKDHSGRRIHTEMPLFFNYIIIIIVHHSTDVTGAMQ